MTEYEGETQLEEHVRRTDRIIADLRARVAELEAELEKAGVLVDEQDTAIALALDEADKPLTDEEIDAWLLDQADLRIRMARNPLGEGPEVSYPEGRWFATVDDLRARLAESGGARERLAALAAETANRLGYVASEFMKDVFEGLLVCSSCESEIGMPHESRCPLAILDGVDMEDARAMLERFRAMARAPVEAERDDLRARLAESEEAREMALRTVDDLRARLEADREVARALDAALVRERDLRELVDGWRTFVEESETRTSVHSAYRTVIEEVLYVLDDKGGAK